MSLSKFNCLTVAFALAASTAALAESEHVAQRPYIEQEVVSLTGRADFESTILFDKDEKVENIAVGKSDAWQVTPNRRANLIFFKPISATAPMTNMTVVTDRHTYLFELVASAKATPLYLLRFTYPEGPAAKDESPPEAIVATPSEEPTALPINQLNFAWTMSGTKALYPERCFDDGGSVYLAWKAGRALPAVLSIGPDGKTEGPVNYTANGDYLVVEGFHDRLILRSGKDMATLQTRHAPQAVAIAANTE